MWAPTISSDELYHHGILGQRWGKRNGPPYPLDAEDHSAAEKRKMNLGEKRKGLTDEQKENLKIAAKITGGVLLGAAVVGGTIYLAKTGKLDDLIVKGKEIVESKSALSSDFASAGKGATKTAESVINKINPLGGNENCGACAIALEAEQRGIPVHAKNIKDGMTIAQMGQMFKGINQDTFLEDFNVLNSSHFNAEHGIITLTPDKIQAAFASDLATKYPSGSRGLMFVPRTFGMSHYISWENKGGTIKFYNSQDPKLDIAKDVFGHYKYFKNNSAAKITAMRLDNLEFNMDNIGSVVESNNPIKRLISSKIGSEEFNANVIKGQNFLSTYK